MIKTKKTKSYPDSLKNQPKSKILKKPNGEPYRWGTVMPLIGGFPLGAAKATGVKPQFIASWPAFVGNDKHIMEYWKNVPLVAINDDNEAEAYELKEGEEDNSILTRYTEPLDEDLFKDLDFVVSVPLCSGLSMLNASNGKSESSRGSDAVQNKWIYETARFALDKIKPRAFVGENAPGLFTKMGEGVVENLKAIGKEFDYNLVLYKTNTNKHGIPQSRHRTFYFFFRDYLPQLELINKERLDYDNFLKLIPDWATYQDSYQGTSDITENPLTNCLKTYLIEETGSTEENWMDELIGTTTINIENTIGYDKAIEWIENNYDEDDKAGKGAVKFLIHVKKKIALNKGWWDATHLFLTQKGTNAVISKTMRSFVHPTESRTLNDRELFWMMGMPHDFTVSEDKEIYHVTQNVPVTTAADIIGQLIMGIEGKLPLFPGHFLKINNDIKIKLSIEDDIKKLF